MRYTPKYQFSVLCPLLYGCVLLIVVVLVIEQAAIYVRKIIWGVEYEYESVTRYGQYQRC